MESSSSFEPQSRHGDAAVAVAATASNNDEDDLLITSGSGGNDEDNNDNNNNDTYNHKNSFSLIQSRKFLAMDWTSHNHHNNKKAKNDDNNNRSSDNDEQSPPAPQPPVSSSTLTSSSKPYRTKTTGNGGGVAKFCPSMDLIVVESNQPSSIVIYRTISWQKVATIPIRIMTSTITDPTALSSTTIVPPGPGGSLMLEDSDTVMMGVTTTTTTTIPQLQQQQQQSTVCYCWSPNGQAIAVAQSKLVALYGIESLANPATSMMDGNSSGGSGGGDTGGGSGDGDDDDGNHSMFSFATKSGYPIRALHWAHVGRDHPTAWKKTDHADYDDDNDDDDDYIRDISWRYQSYYVDRSTSFLPPSAYYNRNSEISLLDDPSESQQHQQSHLHRGYDDDDDDDHDVNTLSNTVPECKTPLSVLCVSTDCSFELYLHGRYPLLTLPRQQQPQQNDQHLSATPPLVVASNDLAYWLMMTTSTTTADSKNEYGDDRSSSKDQKSPTAVPVFLQQHQQRPTLSLYHTPFLSNDRYVWQQIAALHTSITAHTKTLQQSVSIVANNWKNSLKPLDMKLQPLIGLLKNYGVDVVVPGTNTKNKSRTQQRQQQPQLFQPTLQAVMKEYIMMGHTSHSTSIANAMDQFFTNVQMNDQLLQRMERSLYASMANVESAAISCIVRPTQALAWQIQELVGIIRSFDDAKSGLEHDDDDELLDEGKGYDDDEKRTPLKSKRQLLDDVVQASEQLWISAEHLLTYIVTSRLLVRDLCGWLRHAGSQVKARGTAINSVQRDNAKKRRVPQDVLERLVSVLGIGQNDEVGVDAMGRLSSNTHQQSLPQMGLTESLLSLKVTEMLKSPSDQGLNKDAGPRSPLPRPQSPLSVASTYLQPIPKVQPSLERTIEAAISLFQNPLSNVPSQIHYQELLLPSHHGASIVATHSRIGRDYDTKHSVWDSDDDDDERTYLLPIIADEMNHTNFPISSLDRCRQWFLIAQAYGNVVQLFCLPLGWRHTVAAGEDDAIDEDYGDNSDRNSNCTFYLTTKLVFPQGGSIQDLGFYGDDGKSSLSSGQDSGTGMEGRQKLGVIYHHSSSSVELWMTSYDSCVWQAMPCEAELVNPTEIDTSCTLNIVRTPRTGSTDPGYDTMDDVTVSYADTRKIPGIFNEAPSVNILLCGSRGMGAVAIASDEGVISLEVLDLEDDEQEEDDDDDVEDLMEDEIDDFELLRGDSHDSNMS